MRVRFLRENTTYLVCLKAFFCKMLKNIISCVKISGGAQKIQGGGPTKILRTNARKSGPPPPEILG